MSTAIDLTLATNNELLTEMHRRGLLPRCTCSRWSTYVGAWDLDGYTWRCTGCNRAIRRCACT